MYTLLISPFYSCSIKVLESFLQQVSLTYDLFFLVPDLDFCYSSIGTDCVCVCVLSLQSLMAYMSSTVWMKPNTTLQREM